MEQAFPREYTYAFALTTILLDECCPEKSREAKLDALRNSMGLTNYYLKEGIRPDLVDVIMKKKADLILSASTIADIRKAGEPPKPHFTGNTWYDDPLQVPEEEMILWSHVSFQAPLSEYGFNRYVDLFTRCFGMTVEEYCRGDGDALCGEEEP